MRNSEKLDLETGPNGAMVRGFFHAADLVIYSRLYTFIQQWLGGQNQVYTQAAFGIVFKAAAAVIKPAE